VTSQPTACRQTSHPAWRDWFAERRAAVDRIITEHVAALRAADPGHSRLIEAGVYSLTQGGKRLRPILVLESCAVCGGQPTAAHAAALAVECIHTFSLIHDDLPAMDDDDLRRGQPTSHKVFGEALAVLAGDWLSLHAFRLLAEARLPVTADLVAALPAGSLGMVEGQGADIAGEQRPPATDLVEYIHRHKTAGLIEACCRLGALSAAADAEAVAALGRYGRHLGLAFQIVDDVLDETSTTAALGKRAGKDAAVSKQTYPAVFGRDASRAQARREVDAATAALAPFGAAAQRLCELAEVVVTRDH